MEIDHAEQIINLQQKIASSYQTAKTALFTLDIDSKTIITDPQNDLSMQFYLMSKLQKKNQSSQRKLPEGAKFNPFLSPQKQLLITDLGETHRLLFNKFNIFHNHLLVVTREFQRQDSGVTSLDIVNSSLVCQALNGVMFFNGGQHSGASQEHKHLQIIPPEAKQLPILATILKWVNQNIQEKGLQQLQDRILSFPLFSFKHGIVLADSSKKLSVCWQQAYNRLHQQLIGNSGHSFNLVATKDMLMMVVRCKENALDQLSVNSLGFMGSLLFKDQQTLNAFKERTPEQILADICQKQ